MGTVDVRLASMVRESSGTGTFLFYSDDPDAGLPLVRVRPGKSVFQVAEALAAACGESELLGVSRFAHTIDPQRKVASIVITFVATAGDQGAAWQSLSAFSEAEQPLLQWIASGHVYPLCLLSEDEGSGLHT